ncbi:unnamed protein product [Gordionus sp. m RMFG-2023]|uniref:probable serine/threonine-protein kinase clkA n=1 Tax=Gordionus sp. m RMFG-2023 TaxID=3053472 RepID=UPI0030DFDD65
MNAFMIFAKIRRGEIQRQNPNFSNNKVSVILGQEWKSLPTDQKKPYKRKAEELDKMHKIMHPDYVYSPAESRKKKAERMLEKVGKKTIAKHLKFEDTPKKFTHKKMTKLSSLIDKLNKYNGSMASTVDNNLEGYNKLEKSHSVGELNLGYTLEMISEDNLFKDINLVQSDTILEYRSINNIDQTNEKILSYTSVPESLIGHSISDNFSLNYVTDSQCNTLKRECWEDESPRPIQYEYYDYVFNNNHNYSNDNSDTSCYSHIFNNNHNYSNDNSDTSCYSHNQLTNNDVPVPLFRENDSHQHTVLTELKNIDPNCKIGGEDILRLAMQSADLNYQTQIKSSIPMLLESDNSKQFNNYTYMVNSYRPTNLPPFATFNTPLKNYSESNYNSQELRYYPSENMRYSNHAHYSDTLNTSENVGYRFSEGINISYDQNFPNDLNDHSIKGEIFYDFKQEKFLPIKIGS